MNISFFLYKGDIKCFIRRNWVKFLFGAILLVLSAVFAVRNAVMLDDLNEFFENKGGIIFPYMRGGCSLFAVVALLLLEYLILLCFVLLCSYNNFCLLFSFATIVFVGYVNIFCGVVVLLYFSVRALPFFILYMAFTLIFIAVMIGYICLVCESQCRYKYGIKEIPNLAVICLPIYIVFAVLYLLQILIICFGCLFV